MSKKHTNESFQIPWTYKASKGSIQYKDIDMKTQGDNKHCDTDLSCIIDLPPHEGDDDVDEDDEDYCPNGYLRVTDGYSGFRKFCGKTKFTKLRAGVGLRDLFIELKRFDHDDRVKPKEKIKNVTKKPAVHGGVKCIARCIRKDVEKGERLPANLKRKYDPRCACGLQNQDDRIVGGEDARMAEFPWQAAIVFPESREPFCGASVINDRWILTAAHCFWFDGKKPEEMEVLVHALLLDQTIEEGAKENQELGEQGSLKSRGHDWKAKTDEDENTLRYRVLEIINHPLFDAEYDFDFALLRVDKKIDFFNGESPVTPICLPPADAFDSLMDSWEGQMMTVSGWGKAAANAGGTTRLLQKLDVPYIPFSQCKTLMSDMSVTRRMLCAGFVEGGKDACTGDSGGPLTVPKKEGGKQMWQIGVVSWGEGCADAGRPGIYSRVTDAMQWIHFHVGRSQEDGVTKWCEEA